MFYIGAGLIRLKRGHIAWARRIIRFYADFSSHQRLPHFVTYPACQSSASPMSWSETNAGFNSSFDLTLPDLVSSVPLEQLSKMDPHFFGHSPQAWKLFFGPATATHCPNYREMTRETNQPLGNQEKLTTWRDHGDLT